MAAIFYLSNQSDLPNLPAGLSGYTGHAIGYGLLAALVLRALARASWPGVRAAPAWRAVLITSAYGATDEFHQSFVAGRAPELLDWMADTAGAAFAVLLVMRIARTRRRDIRTV